MRAFSLTIALALSMSMPGAARAAGQVDDAWRYVASEFEDGARDNGTVGASLLLARDGKVVKSAFHGLSDKEAGRKVDADTIYHWASITKLFTTVAVLQLRDRGKLGLEDPIISYLPEAKRIRNTHGPMSQITLRHLLTHSSGLRARTFPWRGDRDWAPREPAEWSQIAAMMPYTDVEFAPGSKYSYSNLGMSMLGRVVEEITGEDIEIYITKNILMPLGMTRSFFDVSPYHLLPYRSANYEVTQGAVKPGKPDVDTGATKANGGLSGPASDLLKFGNFLIGVGDNGHYATVLSRTSVQEMMQPTLAAGDDPLFRQQMGLGTFIVDTGDKAGGRKVRLVGHTGSQANFVSFLYLHPESRSAAVFAMNTFNDDQDFSRSPYTRARAGLFTRLFPLLAR